MSARLTSAVRALVAALCSVPSTESLIGRERDIVKGAFALASAIPVAPAANDDDLFACVARLFDIDDDGERVPMLPWFGANALLERRHWLRTVHQYAVRTGADDALVHVLVALLVGTAMLNRRESAPSTPLPETRPSSPRRQSPKRPAPTLAEPPVSPKRPRRRQRKRQLVNIVPDGWALLRANDAHSRARVMLLDAPSVTEAAVQRHVFSCDVFNLVSDRCTRSAFYRQCRRLCTAAPDDQLPPMCDNYTGRRYSTEPEARATFSMLPFKDAVAVYTHYALMPTLAEKARAHADV